jgi:photosystem II stability/assembly factor-like uncharacterized protein
MRLAAVVLLSATALAQWQPQESHTPESLRGVSVFNQTMVWASGTHGTYLFSTDGTTWTAAQVPGAESLDFRGVKSYGFDAFLLASGPGDKSRIYYTPYLGKHWDLQFTNSDPKGFFDCMAFFDPSFAKPLRGIIVGDPVNGRFQILRTINGGKTWQYSDPQKMPPALDGEGAFAASNTCVTTMGKKNVWFGTGGPAARVFRSTNGGKSWKVSSTPILHGTPSQGIFSIAFHDARHGVISGGDYQHPEQSGANLATTDDGGKTWKLVPTSQQQFFSAIAYVSGDVASNWIIAVGSHVSGFSTDALQSWQFFSATGFNAADSKMGVVYAVGADGRIARAQLGTCGRACVMRVESKAQ